MGVLLVFEWLLLVLHNDEIGVIKESRRMPIFSVY